MKTQKEMPTSRSARNWKCSPATGSLRGPLFPSTPVPPHQAFPGRLGREQQFAPLPTPALPIPPPCLTLPHSSHPLWHCTFTQFFITYIPARMQAPCMSAGTILLLLAAVALVFRTQPGPQRTPRRSPLTAKAGCRGPLAAGHFRPFPG